VQQRRRPQPARRQMRACCFERPATPVTKSRAVLQSTPTRGQAEHTAVVPCNSGSTQSRSRQTDDDFSPPRPLRIMILAFSRRRGAAGLRHTQDCRAACLANDAHGFVDRRGAEVSVVPWQHRVSLRWQSPEKVPKAASESSCEQTASSRWRLGFSVSGPLRSSVRSAPRAKCYSETAPHGRPF